MADDLLTMKIAIDDRDYLKVQNSQKKFQYSLVEIERAYRKGEITSKQYNRQLVIQTKELQRLGFTYAQASSQVRQYSYSLRNATVEQLNHAQAMSISGKGMRRFELFAQQAGYQVGDFAVQVQSGTNVAVAFGQQASQLLGFLGPTGAVAGAGIAIATGFLAPLLRSKDATRDLNKELEELEKTLGSVAIGAEASIEAGLTAQLIAAQSEINRIIALTKSEDFQRAMGYAGPTQAAIAGDIINETVAAQEELVNTTQDQIGNAKILETQERVRAALQGDQVQEAQNYLDVQRLMEEFGKRRKKQLEWEEGAEERLANVARNRWNFFMAQLKARQKLETLISSEQKRLQDQNAVLQMQLQFGKDSAAVRQLEKDIAVEKYEKELLGKGVAEDTVKILSDQYRISLNLTDQLKDQVAQAREFKKQLQDASTAYGKSLKIGAAADAFDPRGEAGMTATEALRLGANPFVYGRGNKSKTAKTTPTDVVGDMLKQVQHQRKLLELTEDQRRGEEIRFELLQQLGHLNDDRIEKLIKESEVLYRATQAEERRQEQIDRFSGHIENAFMAMVDGSQSVENAFKSLMRNIILDIYQQMVAQRAASTIMSFLPFANGGTFSGGKVTPFASGGVVSRPTLFPMANGAGLMGEAGPEAIMPLKRGKDGKLGVEGGGTTIVQNINVSTGVQQTVRTEIKSLMPQIADAAKGAVVDAKRRGGSYGRVFN